MAEPDKYASVTSLTGLLPKNLTWWAGNAVADCAFNKQDEWKGLPDREARYEYVRRAHQRLKSDAADLGTEVHKYVEAVNLGKPVPSVPLPARARMHQFSKFIADYRPRIEAAETKVYHRETHRHRSATPGCLYAGTLDMLAWIEDDLAVIDIKTGKGVYEEAALQINAYAHADFLVADPFHPGARQITPKGRKRWYEWTGPSTDEIPMPEVTKGYVLHLRDDHYELVEVPIREDLYRTFLALFAVNNWESRQKKGVLTVVGRSTDDDYENAKADAAIAEFGGGVV